GIPWRRRLGCAPRRVVPRGSGRQEQAREARSLDDNETYGEDRRDRPRRPESTHHGQREKDSNDVQEGEQESRPVAATTDRVEEAAKDEEGCRRLPDAPHHVRSGP